jgi:hypothetical protein
MTALEAAEILTERFGREVTRCSLIAVLNRKGIAKGATLYTAGKKRKSKSKIKPITTFPKKTSVQRIILETIETVPYQPKWTCQYFIGDTTMCGTESNGPWCEEHKKIVFLPQCR